MANPYEYRGSGDEFLQDYSPLAGVASAVQGFGEAFERAQDRSYKRMEQNAQMEALKAKAQRDTFEHSITQRKQKAILESSAHGQEPDFNENGEVVGTHYKPEYLQMQKDKLDSQAANREIRVDQSADTKDRREHERVLSRIASNPVLKQRLQQSQNLDNALSIVTQSDHLTPQQVHEFQQAIRGNLGIKGGSGVGEREETYFKSLGLNAANWSQFLTGEPADLAKDSKMIQHLKNLALLEQKNIRSQVDKAIGAAAGGHASMYKRRADLKGDLQDAMNSYTDQMPSGQPQGLVPTGMVKPGLVGAEAAQDPKISQYAKQYGLDYAHAAQILKQRGYNGQ